MRRRLTLRKRDDVPCDRLRTTMACLCAVRRQSNDRPNRIACGSHRESPFIHSISETLSSQTPELRPQHDDFDRILPRYPLVAVWETCSQLWSTQKTRWTKSKSLK
ncbi:hypothetical protein PHSY_002860 [Pseudozyma hubeiensis SY62]|uniref:Uncharacterized protein n=1 Tax=Pseudozyma hubeiensis (strain SY62) TaxID=1305764 RepID=R9PB45_PSEHS|nr:hypothetical protein PHSY_002860 [Pseudozyma hubeiensis SY62]GAC95285.1 hypothetical protein PHSY_002860 [Pseudozyma hubeiensis SY62]